MVPNEEDFIFLALCTREYKGYVTSLQKGRLRDGIRYILSMSRHGNQYMQSNQPWVLLKGSSIQKLVFLCFGIEIYDYSKRVFTIICEILGNTCF